MFAQCMCGVIVYLPTNSRRPSFGQSFEGIGPVTIEDGKTVFRYYNLEDSMTQQYHLDLEDGTCQNGNIWTLKIAPDTTVLFRP